MNVNSGTAPRLDLETPEAFRLEWGPPGIAVLLYDHPEGRVNLLTSSALAELRRHLVTLAQEPTLRGLLLTLKLNDWEMAAEVPELLRRVAAMGMTVRATQLPSNRQEIFVYGQPAR